MFHFIDVSEANSVVVTDVFGLVLHLAPSGHVRTLSCFYSKDVNVNINTSSKIDPTCADLTFYIYSKSCVSLP